MDKEVRYSSGSYGDGNGLYLQVSNRNTKAWIFRFMIRGRPRKMGLGDIDHVSLKDARKLAQAKRLLVVDGIDPIEERNARRIALVAGSEAAKAKATTFRQCAKDYIKAHQPGWKSAKHGSQWAATLETYAFPVIGSLPVALVDRNHVLKILEPIWTTRTETASRVRGRIEKILDRARAIGLRDGENPARWIGGLDQLLAPKSQVSPVEHFAALPYGSCRISWRSFAPGTASARGLWNSRFSTSLAPQTRSERPGPRSMRRTRTWTIKGTLLKGKKGKRRPDHVIPLSDRAMTLLGIFPARVNSSSPAQKKAQGSRTWRWPKR